MDIGIGAGFSEGEVRPNVRVVFASGHLPGHLLVDVSSGGERLLYTSETLIVASATSLNG